MSEDPHPEKPEPFDEESDVVAFAYGIWHGFRRLNPKPKLNPSVKTNKVYYYPAYIIGYVIKIACVVILAEYGMSGF